MSSSTACLPPAATAPSNSCSNSTGTPLPTLVIGAGMSGLATAKNLLLNGRPVKVIEGRNRIGGRTYTADISGTAIDLGGAWIHGTTNNPIEKLATALGLQTSPHSVPAGAAFDAVTDKPFTIDQWKAMIHTYERMPAVADELRVRLGPKVRTSFHNGVVPCFTV